MDALHFVKWTLQDSGEADVRSTLFVSFSSRTSFEGDLLRLHLVTYFISLGCVRERHDLSDMNLSMSVFPQSSLYTRNLPKKVLFLLVKLQDFWKDIEPDTIPSVISGFCRALRHQSMGSVVSQSLLSRFRAI